MNKIMCKNNRKERKGALSIFVSFRRGSSRAVVVTVARTVLQHAVVESSGSGWTQGKSEIWVGWTVWAVVGVEVDQGILADWPWPLSQNVVVMRYSRVSGGDRSDGWCEDCVGQGATGLVMFGGQQTGWEDVVLVVVGGCGEERVRVVVGRMIIILSARPTTQSVAVNCSCLVVSLPKELNIKYGKEELNRCIYLICENSVYLINYLQFTS